MNSLEKKLIAAIGAVFLLLVVVGIIAFNAITTSIETSQQVASTHEILTEVEATLSLLKDAESGQRGYILAGRDDALDHFSSAKESTQKKLGKLKALTAKNTRHQERLSRAEPAINNKYDRINKTISLRKNEGFDAAKDAVLTDEEIREMDQIRHLLGEISDEENQTLQNRIVLAENSRQNVIVSFASLFILILSLLLLVFFLVRKDFATQKQLQEKLRELATVDELTTLYNRREINRCFKNEIEKFQRYKQPFSLLLLDIDHFKSVNDKYGHQTGDKVLQWAAAQIRGAIRAIDIPGRFGGEEFAVILPNTNDTDAYLIAERMRKKIAAQPFRLQQNDNSILEVPITVSIGVSVFIDKDDTETDIIRTADSALYQAKSEGRDRTIMFNRLATLQ